LQAHGRRRWRIGRQKDLSLQEGLPGEDPAAHFQPEEEFVLEPGDMLYLPPRYAHDGVALDDCMTCSIGFQAPARMVIWPPSCCSAWPRMHPRKPGNAHVPRRRPARCFRSRRAIPPGLADFAQHALERAWRDPLVLARSLGEHLTEPKAQVWFDEVGRWHCRQGGALRLDRRTRMMYDERRMCSSTAKDYRAAGRDATADALPGRRQRVLDAARFRESQCGRRAELLQEPGSKPGGCMAD
jgi:50S ribosomal protein L16 3-hydroxylase